MKDKSMIKEAFDNYVSKCNFVNERIKNKYNHVFRVASICEQIAISIKDEYDLGDDDIQLAYLIGILHDISRFDDIYINNKRFFDHGDYGADLLRNGLIRDFINENNYDDIIFESVKQHNKFRIKDKYDRRINMYINILRDADKLDIYYEFASRIINIYDVIYDGNISNDVLEKFNNYQLIDKKITNTQSDKFLSTIAMVYDLNFKYSLKYLKEKKYIDIIFNQINIKDDEKYIYIDLKNVINKYVDMEVIND